MSESLPENLEDWPTDPFALMGVSRSVNHQELRRAYTRLIRQFKPEQAPEQFRRIRSAYETLQGYAAWNEAAVSDATDEVQEPPNPEVENDSRAVASSRLPQSDASSRIASEQCWGWALNGEVSRAYAGLRDLQTQQPDQVALVLRLYWILYVAPQLEPERSPLDWLVCGLRSCEKYDRLLHVYSNELIYDPGEALKPRFEQLLEQSQRALRLELLERRWCALARLELWAVANNDLDCWQERICREDELAWLRLLLSMSGKSFHVLPSSEYSVFQKCARQIKTLSHLSLTHPKLFDRAEYLNHLAYESTALAPGPLRDVVIYFLAERMEDAAAAAEPFLTLTCQNPKTGLEVLDQAAGVAPNMLHEFSRALDWLSWNTRNEEMPTLADGVAEGVLYALLNGLLKYNSYTLARPEILQYCCDEGLSPMQICRLLQAPHYAPNNLGYRIARDLPLRCTYEAFRLGWLS
jgi:hypothetical protein